LSSAFILGGESLAVYAAPEALSFDDFSFFSFFSFFSPPSAPLFFFADFGAGAAFYLGAAGRVRVSSATYGALGLSLGGGKSSITGSASPCTSAMLSILFSTT